MQILSNTNQHYLGFLLAANLFLTSCMPAAQAAALRPAIQQDPASDDAGGKIYLPIVSRDGTPSSVTPTATPTNTPAPQLQLNPIGNQIARLGVTLILKLSANNPSGGSLTYSVAPLPLPLNAAFNPATGEFSFKPDIAQIGEYSLAFSVSNGAQSATETIKINVPQPPANGATTLSGRILDANEAAAGRDVPLAGATVRLMNSSTPLSTTTASDGSFHFTGVPEGEQYFEYDGSSASSSVATKGSYGAYRGQKVIVAHVDNPIERPIYIMKIDMAGKTIVTPTQQTLVNNPNISVTLDIPANTVLNDQGQLYSGPISVSPVPDEFTPSSLPNNLNPSRVVTIQPMGLTFQQPVPVRFPNEDHLAKGSIVNIWSMDHKLGKFFIAGKGKVSEDGLWVESIPGEGGIRESSWHFILALLADAVGSLFDNNLSCSTPPPSSINLNDGCLQSMIQLPGYTSLGGNQQLALSYLSQRAWPVPILPFEATLPLQAAVPNQISYELRSFGGIASSDIAKYFVRPDSFQENQDERFRGALAVMADARTVGAADLTTSILDTALATAIYPWTIRLTNHYGASEVSTDLSGRYPVVNEQSSPIGAGWGLAGLQHIYPQDDESLFLINGDGASARFGSSTVLLDDDFNNEEAVGNNYSSLLNWRIVRGSVDLFGPGYGDELYPENGKFIDLDGTTGTAAKLETQTEFLFAPGDYRLSYSLGNTFFPNDPQDFRNAENKVHVSLGNIYSATFSLKGQSALQLIEQVISVSNPTSAKLIFDHEGGDYYGIILDDVKLERVRIRAGSASVISSTLQLDSQSNIFGAGHRNAPAPAGGGGGLRPSGFRFVAGTQQFITFSDVSGELHCYPSAQPNGPDGGPCQQYGTNNVTSLGGISGIIHDKTMFLIGIFLSDAEPRDPAPNRLDFSGNSDFIELSPNVNQTFFIGDGKDSSGRLQRFFIPPGASRLYLGFIDAYFDGTPGYFADNVGSLSIALQLSSVNSDDESYIAPSGDFSTLTRNPDNSYTRRMKDGTLYTFDAAGLQTAVTDRNGNKTAYRYDGNGRLTNIVDPAGLETILMYNGALLQSIKDPMGRTTTFEHNSAGDLTKVIFPDGSNRQFGYDSRHLMTSETDERGKTTTRLYDDYGRLISAELPEDVTRSTTYAQKVGLITNPGEGTINNPAQITRPEVVSTTVKDGEKHRTIYTFGPLQSIASVVDPAGFKTTIERNADGNPTKFTYPSGQVINQEFESNGNLKIVNDPTVQGTTTFSYEPLFNQPQTIKDAFGNVTTLSYDGKGNPIQILSPLQRSLRMAYDTHGLPMVMTDTLGTVANFSYNNRGDLTQMKWGSGAATRTANFTYTPHGYLQNMSDPLLRPFAYRYDDLGRLISETLPSNRTVIYQYDAAGNLTSLTPPGRPAHSFEYDGLGMMTGYTPPAVNGVANPKTSYAYNKAQQLTQLTRPDGKLINYSYDSAGRLTTIQASRGNLNYSYSPTSGQLSAINAPDNVNLDFQYQGDLLTDESWSGALNGTVQRSYDKGYRTASLSVNGVAISYQYDADNAPTKAGDLNLSYQPTSGLLANSTLGTVNDSFGYNAFAELQSYSANAGATPLFQTNYARDALGRITTLTETITSTTFVYVYGYDPAGRLATVQRNGTPIASYGYDANGNRLSASDSNGTSNGSYDNQDRLLSYGNTTYSYTANGELTSKKIGNNPATTYSYDEFGNLLSVKLPNNETISYLVDGKDRRIGRKLNGVLQKGWIYEDQLRPVAELDGSGAVSSRFVYATRINVPDYMVKGGVTYRLILDHLGSVRLVVNTQTGEVVQRMDYDAWGVVTQDTNPGFQPFGFAGGLWDGQTGLVRFGARDYDARVGRWTSKDPIGFEGGEPDLYTYVANQPVDISDSSGLEVYLCRRPADMPFPFNLVDHHWIKTSTYEAGMGGMNGNVPGQNGNSDWPYSQTRTNDHLGQSQAENSTCVKIPNANEECVNSLIKPGQPTGRWTTQNQCQSFAQSVIEKCGGDYPGVCNPYILAKVGKCVKAYWR